MFHRVRQGNLQYSVADSLAGASHGFTTRLGGVSTGHLASLNLGHHRGDDPANVYENYRILGHALGFAPEDTVFPVQRHTDIIRVVSRENRGEGLFRETPTVCDGQITDEPGVALVAFGADCTPVLLFDPVRRAVGAVHAGWRGTAMGIAKKAVEAMSAAYGCRPGDIRAAIGPCIGQCCFETDGDVPAAMINALGSEAEAYIVRRGAKYHVDLKGINAWWLSKAGVETVDVSPDCTACDTATYWSHRRVGDHRGSQAGVIILK